MNFFSILRKRNIFFLMMFTFWEMFLLLTPVTIPYFSSFKLSMKEILSLQSVFALSVAVMEIPTGYFADRWGRKNILIVGALFRGCAFALLPFVSTFSNFIIFEILYGISTSFVSGANISLLFETLKKMSISPDKNVTYIGLMNGVALFAEAFATILGGVLASFSFGLLAIIASIVNWFPLICLLLMRTDLYEPSEKISIKKMIKELRYIFTSHDKTILITSINSIAIGLVTYSLIWPIQKKWDLLKLPIYFFGLIPAIITLMNAFISPLIGKLEDVFGIHKIVGGSYLMAQIGLLLLLSNNLYLVITASVFLMISRVLQISNDNLLYSSSPERYLATLISIISLGFRGAFFIIAPLIGFCIDSFGLPAFFKIMNIVLIILAVAILPYYFKKIRT